MVPLEVLVLMDGNLIRFEDVSELNYDEDLEIDAITCNEEWIER